MGGDNFDNPGQLFQVPVGQLLPAEKSCAGEEGRNSEADWKRRLREGWFLVRVAHEEI